VLLDRAAAAPSMKRVDPGNRCLNAKVRAFADFVAEKRATSSRRLL